MRRDLALNESAEAVLEEKMLAGEKRALHTSLEIFTTKPTKSTKAEGRSKCVIIFVLFALFVVI